MEGWFGQRIQYVDCIEKLLDPVLDRSMVAQLEIVLTVVDHQKGHIPYVRNCFFSQWVVALEFCIHRNIVPNEGHHRIGDELEVTAFSMPGDQSKQSFQILILGNPYGA